MKMLKLTAVVLALALALFIMVPSLSWAEDGAALYKTKCAACHAPDGAGKPAMKAPALKGVAADTVVNVLTKGGKKGPHASAMKSVTPEQAKAIADFIQTLK